MRPRFSLCAGLGLFAAVASAAPLTRADAGSGPKIDPTWLQIDSTKKEVSFALIAAMGGDNSGMNFNGSHEGGLTLTVPAGWGVTLRFINKDAGMNHGATVVPYHVPIQDGAVSPVIAGAATDTTGIGLTPGSKASLHFTATPAGKYSLRCSASGHSSMGMWLILNVSKDAALPSIEVTTSKP